MREFAVPYTDAWLAVFRDGVLTTASVRLVSLCRFETDQFLSAENRTKLQQVNIRKAQSKYSSSKSKLIRDRAALIAPEGGEHRAARPRSTHVPRPSPRPRYVPQRSAVSPRRPEPVAGLEGPRSARGPRQ